MARIDLISPHSPVAAAQRLKAAVGDTLTPDTPRCVTGNGTEDHMMLWVHRPRHRNDFKTVLTATMEPFAGGSRIAGRIGPPITAIAFMGCWFSFVSIFLSFGLFGAFVAASGSERWIALPFIGIPALMLAMGAGMVWIGRRHGRADQDEILAFLSRTLATRPYRNRDL